METVITKSALHLEEIKISKAALVIRAINHPLRNQMLRLLHQNKQMTVTALFLTLHLDQTVASQHLAILRKAKFVLTERKGKCIYYSVNYERIGQFESLVLKLISG